MHLYNVGCILVVHRRAPKNYLNHYRTIAKLTQKDLAEKSRVTQQQISYLENGKRSAHRQSLEDCRALADALAAAGAINAGGHPVTIDDVFPPELEERKPEDTAAA